MSDPFHDADLPTQRREARERAISLLYEAEMKSLGIAEVIEALPFPPDDLVTLLATGVGDHQDHLDECITGSLDATWSLERLATLDRIILRLGAFELSHRPEVPTGAIINEAVEMAKHFSGPDAAHFVNAVMSTLSNTLR